MAASDALLEDPGMSLVPEHLPSLHYQKAPRPSSGWLEWSPVSALAAAVLSPGGQRTLRVTLKVIHALARPLQAVLRAARPHRPLPPIDDPLLLHSATELARRIRTQQVTSEEVVSAYIARVHAVEPLLNAVVEERFAAALEEARAADVLVAEAQSDPERLEQIARDRPLLGVPLTVKESLAVAGLSNTAGMLSLRGRRAQQDAVTIRLLRQAGAIPLLVSTCPELCMFYETFNRVNGTSRNPHDTRRTPGGSSGGEAALLGAGASVIGMGSDIGGSLRIPTGFTGVFGHKPTAGVVSDIGHWPRSDDEDWKRFFTVGPMSRYAEDLLPLLKIISKEEVLPLLKLDEKVQLSDLRIFYIENDSSTTDPVNPEIISGLHRAINHLQTVCTVAPKKIEIKELQRVLELTIICLFRLEGIGSVFQIGDNPNEWKSVTWEWLKFFVGLSESNLYALVYGPMKYLFDKLPQNIILEYITLIGKLRAQFEEILKDDGVLLQPTFTQTAVFHREMYCLFPSGSYCTIFNILQMPSTSCPVGKSTEGLPIGIQIAASQHQDRLTIAVAQELEKALGGWVKP